MWSPRVRLGLLVLTASLGWLAVVGARAEPSPANPHGGYSSTTQSCPACHQVHQAAGPRLGLRETERQTCYQCHDGNGGATNVRNQFGEGTLGSSTRTSFHPVPQPRDGVQLNCSDCHSPHSSRADDTRLLRARSGGGWLTSPPGAPIGNAFCYGCHGPGSSLPRPYGDHSGFDASVHGVDGTAPLPPSGSEIECLGCHEPHGSDASKLTTAGEEGLCFGCHTQADPNTSGGSNPRHAFTAAANDYVTSDGTPIRIYHHPVETVDQDGGTRVVECASCHNVHVVDRNDASGSSKLVDPADTTAKWNVTWSEGSADMTRGNISEWCTECHVGPATQGPIGAGPTVPYGILLVNDQTRDDDTNVHDKFTLAEWNASARHGPAEANLACTACHDFHGSSNAYMLRERVVSPDGAAFGTVTGFRAVVADWEKLQTLCLTCHPDRGVNHGAPRLCTRCHYHTSGKL